jgi:hypothetical protein
MSIGLVKKNSSSPFQLQRSMVPQSGGAYEDGGFNPKAVYNNDAANAAITSFGQTIGAALTARGDKKKEEVESINLDAIKPISLPDNKPKSDYRPEIISSKPKPKKFEIEDIQKLLSNFKF